MSNTTHAQWSYGLFLYFLYLTPPHKLRYIVAFILVEMYLKTGQRDPTLARCQKVLHCLLESKSLLFVGFHGPHSSSHTTDQVVIIGHALHRALCLACSNQTQTVRVYHNEDSSPSKHEDLTRCCFYVGPVPLAVGQ